MEKLVIEKSKNINGEVDISGSKNSSLPIIASTLIHGGNYKIHNVPEISDVLTMLKLIKQLGGNYDFQNNKLEIDTENINSFEAPYELVKTMRASVLVWGSLLSRFNRAKISFPGGCAIGDRPVDQHIKSFESLGYETEINQGYLETKKKGISGGIFKFDFKSVTGTENAILASIKADRETILKNCAQEPEVFDLIDFLNSLGANIKIYKDEITIKPTTSLKQKEKLYSVIPDRIETGTFLILGLIPGNRIKINKTNPSHLEEPLKILKGMGAKIIVEKNTIELSNNGDLKPFNIKTNPYPGFPTDLQAQFMISAILANGSSTIEETVFPSRFIHVAELRKLGAEIRVKEAKAHITGKTTLKGAKIQASDLRASASLVLGATIAEGKSEISRIYHLDRGYEKIDDKLTKLGVPNWREKE